MLIDMWDQVERFYIPWSIAIILAIALLGLCKWQPRWGRRGFALLWLFGGLVNVYLAWIYPRDYLQFGRFTFLPFYRRFIYMILFRQAVWMGGLLIVWHVYLAFLFFRPKPLSSFSIGLASILLLLLTPLGFGSGFPATLILMLGLYLLYRTETEKRGT